jgi:hypothetical protein
MSLRKEFPHPIFTPLPPRAPRRAFPEGEKETLRRWRLAGVLVGGLVLSGCLGPVPRRPKPVVQPEVAPSAPDVLSVPLPIELPPEVPVLKKARMVAVWAPGMNTDVLGAARALAQRPGMKVTALFPDHFFGDDEKSKRAKALFQTLVSSGQMEVVLTLPEQPVLPLVMDTSNARVSSPTVSALPSTFSWPEDVVDHVSLAREAYRRRWRVSPTGIKMPWGVALGPEFPLIAKLKIGWALLPSSGPVATRIDGFAFPVLRPGLFPSTVGARKEWFDSRVHAVLLASGTVGPIQVGSVEDLDAFGLLAGGTSSWDWAFLSEVVKEGLSATAREKAPSVDFSPWIGDEEENRAWELLGIARRSVNDYLNSGSANLKSLDLAKRTIYSGENGLFFDHFGAERDAGHTEDVRREFMATLAQVYQILGQTPPPEIRQGFSRKGSAIAVGEEPAGVFERDGTVLRWRDALHDDRGPGDYFYPTGPQFPSGAWDLLRFEVRPTETDLTFVFDFAALANPGHAPGGFSLPLLDLYIDINQSPGAGSQDFLPGRPGMAEAADAWEYALSVDGWGARFYQFVPGQGPRSVASFAVDKSSETALSVLVPRRYFRGDPESWGYAVAVMGRSAGGGPLSVDVDPGPDRFGGAVAGRVAPPYIDLLVPEGQSQRRILGAYKSGQDITLPFVRAE